jgi:hypothetical protein
MELLPERRKGGSNIKPTQGQFDNPESDKEKHPPAHGCASLRDAIHL